MWEIHCKILKDFLILDRNKDKVVTKTIILTYITKEEEDFIDNMDKLPLVIKRGDYSFSIKPNQIYCYGEVDLTNGSKDLEQIREFDFCTRDYSGYKLSSNYNYKKHCALSPLKHKELWTETWDSGRIVQYAHGCLGKPERICLFYQYYK